MSSATPIDEIKKSAITRLIVMILKGFFTCKSGKYSNDIYVTNLLNIDLLYIQLVLEIMSGDLILPFSKDKNSRKHVR